MHFNAPVPFNTANIQFKHIQYIYQILSVNVI